MTGSGTASGADDSELIDGSGSCGAGSGSVDGSTGAGSSGAVKEASGWDSSGDSSERLHYQFESF